MRQWRIVNPEKTDTQDLNCTSYCKTERGNLEGAKWTPWVEKLELWEWETKAARIHREHTRERVSLEMCRKSPPTLSILLLITRVKESTTGWRKNHQKGWNGKITGTQMKPGITPTLARQDNLIHRALSGALQRVELCSNSFYIC